MKIWCSSRHDRSAHMLWLFYPWSHCSFVILIPASWSLIPPPWSLIPQNFSHPETWKKHHSFHFFRALFSDVVISVSGACARQAPPAVTLPWLAWALKHFRVFVYTCSVSISEYATNFTCQLTFKVVSKVDPIGWIIARGSPMCWMFF